MHEVWGMAALWLGLALLATLLSIWLRIATALSEIVVGTVAQLFIGAAIGFISFLAPFLGCTAAAFYLLHWTVRASWLAGVAFRPHPSRLCTL